jgi:four helix bundle protein
MQYQNTTIYSRSLELITLTKTILESMPPGFGFLADQLRRASSSVLLNFAEGYGKSTKRDARRYFITARGSILDIAREFELIGNTQHTRGLELCDHLARMLTRFRQ